MAVCGLLGAYSVMHKRPKRAVCCSAHGDRCAEVCICELHIQQTFHPPSETGFVVVAIMKETCRASLLWLLPGLFSCVPMTLRVLWQPPLPSLCRCAGKCPHTRVFVNANGQCWDVDVTARFFGYAAIGWAVVEVAPRVFWSLQW